MSLRKYKVHITQHLKYKAIKVEALSEANAIEEVLRVFKLKPHLFEFSLEETRNAELVAEGEELEINTSIPTFMRDEEGKIKEDALEALKADADEEKEQNAIDYPPYEVEKTC